MNYIYDMVIIGGGPSGMTAGLYACRAKMKVLLLEKMACGGQILLTDTIENFPGFPNGIKGPDLADWMLKQATHFGLEVKLIEAKNIILKKDKKEPLEVKLSSGESIQSLSVIIASGTRWNTLNIPGEEAFTGRGVSYCATCDGPLFKDKDVVVIGGGDAALEDALFLTKFANRVTIVHRRDRLRATGILQEKAAANKRIKFCLNSVAVEIIGNNIRCRAVRVKDVNTGKEKELASDGVFVLVGMKPNSEIVKDLVSLDDLGYIISDDEMRTSANGIFVCGDVRKRLLRQVVTAVGDGATAAYSAQHYVERIKGIEYA